MSKDMGRAGAIFMLVNHLQRIRLNKTRLQKTQMVVKRLSVAYVALTAGAFDTKGQTVKTTVTKP